MVVLGSGQYRYEVSGENFGSLPDGWVYEEATACAVDSNDNVFVFNRGGHPVIVFDSEGNFIKSWGDGVFSTPHGITIGPDDSVYCVDTVDNNLRKFTPDGELLMTIGASGQLVSEGHFEHDIPAEAMSGKPFNRPTHAAIDPRNGDICVADGYSNARVHRFSADGELKESWGESGTGPGEFNIVHAIDIDGDGMIYIGDRENHRVQVFQPDGTHHATWANLSRAAAVAVDDNGLVYVGEYFAGISSNDRGTRLGPRVTVCDRDGNILARLSDQSYGDAPGSFYSPHMIDTDSKGNIYVAEVSYSDYGRNMDPPQELRSMQKLVKLG